MSVVRFRSPRLRVLDRLQPFAERARSGAVAKVADLFGGSEILDLRVDLCLRLPLEVDTVEMSYSSSSGSSVDTSRGVRIVRSP